MKRPLLWAVVLVAMFGTGALAQDLSGNWQGTLKASRDLRVIFTHLFPKVTKIPAPRRCTASDQGAQPIPVSSVTQHESNIKNVVEMIGGTFEGKLSDDGKTMTGAWTQGLQPLPLILVHAAHQSARGECPPTSSSEADTRGCQSDIWMPPRSSRPRRERSNRASHRQRRAHRQRCVSRLPSSSSRIKSLPGRSRKDQPGWTRDEV